MRAVVIGTARCEAEQFGEITGDLRPVEVDQPEPLDPRRIDQPAPLRERVHLRKSGRMAAFVVRVGNLADPHLQRRIDRADQRGLAHARIAREQRHAVAEPLQQRFRPHAGHHGRSRAAPGIRIAAEAGRSFRPGFLPPRARGIDAQYFAARSRQFDHVVARTGIGFDKPGPLLLQLPGRIEVALVEQDRRRNVVRPGRHQETVDKLAVRSRTDERHHQQSLVDVRRDDV